MRYPGPPTSGWATASLVTGLLGFCVPVIPSVVAIWTGITGLNKTRNGRAGGRGMAVAGLALGVAMLLLWGLILAAAVPAGLSRAREQAGRVKCESNLRQISAALIMYTNAHHKHFPDSLEDLVKADPRLSPSLFVCPASGKTPATRATLSSGIASGQHCSYIYLGKGLENDASGDTVVMYEPLADHHRSGMNVLFADGRVEFLNRDDAQPIIAQRAAGMTTIRVNPGAGTLAPATSQE